MGTRRGLVLISIAFALLLLAWVYATTPFSAPDEPAHYLRSLNLAHGTLLGPKVPGPQLPNPVTTAWLARTSRGVVVSASLAPPHQRCLNGQFVARVGRCLASSYTGSYAPLPYLLPAVAIRSSSHADSALYRARLASALACLAFIVLAFALLWRQSALSVFGLLAAVTPETLFISSVINPNGLLVVANLAFLAGLLRIARTPDRAPGWVWIATTLSGATTIMAWQLGWLFAGADVAGVVLLLGWSASRRLVLADRRRVIAAGAVLGVTLTAYVAYAIQAKLLGSTVQILPLGPGLSGGLRQLPIQFYGWVALFGQLNISLPGPDHTFYWLWFAMLVALVLGALLLSSVRRRVVLVAVVIGVLAFPVLFYAWAYRFSGFGLQPRHVMAMFGLIPMLSGEVLFQSRERISVRYRHLIVVGFGVLIAMLQLLSWWENARTMAGLPTAAWFFSHPIWSPPDGWAPWAVIAAAGTIAMTAFAILARSPTPPFPARRR